MTVHENGSGLRWEPIDGDEMDAFCARFPQGNFQQTTAMAALVTGRGHEVDYVGVRRGDEIVAAAEIVYTEGKFGPEGSIWIGPLCDPHDTDALRVLTEGVRGSAHAHKAISVTAWPSDVYCRRDSDGEPVSANDDAALANYAALGWRHAGFTRGYGAVVNRWVYVKDLTGIADEKALLKSYDKRTQWSVKRAASMGVHVRELTDDELGVFAAIERQTAERRSFAPRDEQYFRQFKQAFGDKAHFMVAEIHIAEYVADMQAKRETLQRKVDQLQAKYDEHPTTKTERQLGEESRNLAAADKRLTEAAEFAKDGDVLPAAASLFVEHPQEFVYLFSGSVERYKPFYASALIQHWAMSRCLELGITRYNFYGISGVFDDPNDEGRGVLEFKQGFNGYVEELLGEFTLPVDPVRYGVKSLAHKLLGR
ncbi:peptidoglycan bridge formation protein FemAB [Bifidobacterium ramosum]|uniref:Peptidoglycan bridge formation glycyltransferase FemA/FemB family protein n=1 Tax=Bifidobacterium ramosum TaxID=1798158 RepID=A0A6L4X3V4_9BIFI|nr:peptidoglycan bridge formation protein FemAB [Bifidobacterium ramosum]NEG71402.1 peptidoglycan bridge formation glycyltransferase FemA/FemB family protein [Bifidobacterium ramosum]